MRLPGKQRAVFDVYWLSLLRAPRPIRGFSVCFDIWNGSIRSLVPKSGQRMWDKVEY